MKYLRLTSGIVLMSAGVVGLVVSLLAIFAVREAAGAASKETAMILDSTNDGVVFLKRGTTKIQGLVAETKSRTHALEDTLEDIAEKVRSSPSGKTPLNSLDAPIAIKLQRAQTTVAALQTTLEAFQNTLVLFNSIPRFAKSGSADDGKDVGETQDLSRSLSEASEMLEQISRFLNDVLTDREVTQKSLGDAMVWVKKIQSRLADAENQVGVFRERLVVTEERISNSRELLPFWIDWGRFFAVIMLVCFAFTQIGLLLQAKWLLREVR